MLNDDPFIKALEELQRRIETDYKNMSTEELALAIIGVRMGTLAADLSVMLCEPEE